jgi:hypothetical protein
LQRIIPFGSLSGNGADARPCEDCANFFFGKDRPRAKGRPVQACLSLQFLIIGRLPLAYHTQFAASLPNANLLKSLVEQRGIEPLTSTLRTSRSPN